MYAAIGMAAEGDRKDLLIEAGLVLSSELSLPVVLQRIVDLATRLTGARYGALGVTGPGGRIVEFVTAGVSERERAAIGHPPQGHGILGLLIRDPRPLRLARISDDPRAIGFPPGHPVMHSFLGAPLMAHGRVFGNVYLADKEGGAEFSDEDERTLSVLASQAGIAIANARLYEDTQRRQRWLEAVREVTGSILAGAESTEVLRLVARRARELVGGDVSTIVAEHEGQTDPLRVLASDGHRADEMLGAEVPLRGSLSGEVVRNGVAVAVADAAEDPHGSQPLVWLRDIGPAVLLPLVVRGRPFGTLAVGRLRGRPPIGEEDRRLVETFAEQASLAIEFGRAQEDLKRLALMEDRERIAKELHDGVIQSLFAVGMGLQGTAILASDDELAQRIEGAVEDLDRVIRDLRNYIFGLRPGILADRQLDEALQHLAREFEEKTGVVTVVDIDREVAAELSGNAADLVQLTREALSNVGRHAAASTVRVSLSRAEGGALLCVDDDGQGFDLAEVDGRGSGLRNIRERTSALGGEVRIASIPSEGTTVEFRIPL